MPDHYPLPNLTPPTQKTNTAAITSTTLGRVRGRSLNILCLLLNEPHRTFELGEILDYPAPYIWKYLQRLQKYGLVREQDCFYFLTDKGVSFTNTLPINFNIIKSKVTRTRQKLDTSRQKLDSKSKIIPMQVSLAFWQPKYPIDESTSMVVEVMVAHYNDTASQGKARVGYTYPASYTKWDIAKDFELTMEQLDEVNRVLQNQGIGYVCNYYGGRYKRGLFERWIAMREAEQKIAGKK